MTVSAPSAFKLKSIGHPRARGAEARDGFYSRKEKLFRKGK